MFALIVYLFTHRTMADSGMILGVSRALLLLSRNLLSTAVQLQDVSLVNHMLEFVWTHLEHYMDSVRHSASGILVNIVKLDVLCKRMVSELSSYFTCHLHFTCYSKTYLCTRHAFSHNVLLFPQKEIHWPVMICSVP